MKYIKFLLTGIFFGIVMSKAEIISWFRIYEMFRFDSFHMYGVIGSAVILGMLFVKYTKRKELCCIEKKPIAFNDKAISIYRYLIGGVIFGLGWAMTGACPGPMFVLLGHGVYSMLILIASATLGTYIYGLIRHKLPH
jgi:uncharacterized membrane protein YedE/YeeE